MSRAIAFALCLALAGATSAQANSHGSTYFGGSTGDEEVRAVAHADSEVYIAGVTTTDEIPGVAGGAQEHPASAAGEIFVARLKPGLSAVLQATYFGGTEEDVVTSLAVTADAVYISGWTNSKDLPATTGSAQPWASKYQEVFVARLSRDLRKIERVSYLGGDGDDLGLAMTVGPAGVFVTGRTWSTDLSSPGAAQPQNAGSYDAFAARFDPNLTTVRATYVGGGSRDQGHAIAVSADSVYIAGLTSSLDLPGAAGGAQETLNALGDAFVAQLDLDLAALNQSTYMGGSHHDVAEALALSPDGSVYVLGDTSSKDFPFTEHGAQPQHAWPLDSNRPDAFVARLDSRLTDIHQATYLGGQEADYFIAMLADARRVLVLATTVSSDFPATAGGIGEQIGNGWAAVVANLAPDLRTLVQATYFGGDSTDFGLALGARRDLASGDILEIYVAGMTASSDLPNTAGALQPALAGGPFDGFVARMSPDLRE
jgi:hypothetical protein